MYTCTNIESVKIVEYLRFLLLRGSNNIVYLTYTIVQWYQLNLTNGVEMREIAIVVPSPNSVDNEMILLLYYFQVEI